MNRRARRVLLVLAALMLLPIVLVLALVATETGTRWLAQQARAHLPVNVAYERISGTLVSRVDIGGLRVRDPGRLAVDAARAALAWRPVALLSGRLEIASLELDGVAIQYTPPEAPPESTALRLRALAPGQLAIPLAIEVRRVAITDLSVITGGGEHRLQSLELALHAGPDALQLRELAVVYEGVQVDGRARLTPREAWPLAASLSVSGAYREVPLDAQLAANGSLAALELSLRQAQPFELGMQAELQLLEERPGGQIDVRWRDLRWPLIGPTMLERSQGAIHVSGRQEAFQVTSEVALEGPGLPVSSIELNASGAVGEAEGLPFEIALRWLAKLTDTTALSGNGHASGDLDSIAFEHALSEPFEVTSAGHVRPAGERTGIEIEGRWAGLRWPISPSEGATGPAPSSPQGRYAIRGDLSDFRLEVEAAVAEVEALTSVTAELQGAASAEAPFPFQTQFAWSIDSPLAGTVAGAGKADGNRERVDIEHRVKQPFELSTRGSVELHQTPRIDLAGDWRGVAWPVLEPARVQSERGRYRVEGPVDQLDVSVDAAITTAQLSAAELAASATVRPDRVEGLRIEARALDGRILGTGGASWLPSPSWQLLVRAEGLNPSQLRPDLDGRLDAVVRTNGRIGDAGLSARAELERIEGRLRGYPLLASGTVVVDGDSAELKKLSLNTGDNVLEVDGTVGDRIDASYRISAPRLDQLWPGLGGRLEGNGRITGARLAPTVSARLDGRDLRYADLQLASVDASVALDPGGETRSEVQARIAGLRVPAIEVQSAMLQASGTRADHRLDLSARSTLGALDARVSGRLGDQHEWTGTLGTLGLTATPLGDWALREPVPARIDAGGGELALACIAQRSAAVCVEGRWNAQRLDRARASIDALPVALFAPWLPENVSADGVLNGRGEARTVDDELEASVTVNASEGSFEIRADALDAPLTLGYRNTELQATYRRDVADASVRAQISDGGSASARVRLGADDGRTPRSLDGELRAELPKLDALLSLLPVVSDRIAEAQGRLDADLKLDGNIAGPRVLGTVALRDAAATVPELGIRLEDVALAATNPVGDELRFEGGLTSGDGRLELGGRVRLDPDAGWPASLTLRGDRLQVVRLPSAQALASPDLQIETGGGDPRLRGRVTIPSANIEIKELPRGAVQVSDDEIIVSDDDPQQAPAPTGTNVDAKIELVLGDDVRFSGFGLSTALTGALEVTSAGSGMPTAQGTLSLVGGRYKAYGQDLTIERGRLLFAGPIDNPGLNVRATRKSGDVTAGLAISGNANRISSELFSEPPLPEAEVLSYLLTGGPLGSASSGDASMLANAAISLGLEHSALITREIGDTFGLDEFGVRGGDTLDETAFVVGKSLSPRLFVRYAIGLLNQEGVVEMNYKLTERISIEAESGSRHGADLLYKLER